MISDVYFPRINGVSTSIKSFRDELISMGHEVTLIAPRYFNDDEESESLIRIPARKIPFDPEDRLFKRQDVKRITQELKDKQFDIIHIETPFSAHYEGLRLAKALNIPVVETYHTHFEEYFYHYLPLVPKGVTKSIARQFSRWQCNKVDGIIVPSQAMKEVLEEYGVIKPIEIIPTGMDRYFFNIGNGKAFREKHNIPIDKPVLLHIGRIAHEKNIDFLVHVVNQLKEKIPDILLVIAGEGPALEHLKNLSKKLKLEQNIKFLGYLDRQTELLDCYASGDIFIFASRTETQGLVLLEAMAQGIPVVSTAKLGTVDILSPEQGCIIAEENIDDFSSKLLNVLEDKTLHDRLQEEAPEYAKSWSCSEMAKKVLKYYESIIEQNKCF